MRETYRVSRQLSAEANACGQEFHSGYYLFESYEDVPDNWPLRSEHDDLVYERFCDGCAKSRVRDAIKAGLSVTDPDSPWYERNDELYAGPFYDCELSSDRVRWCLDCGKLLHFSPTDDCLTEELDVYDDDKPINASDLLILSELVDSASHGKHEERALSIAADCLKRFQVPAGVELRSRLPTLAKIKQAWKQVCEPIYFDRD